MQLKASVGTPHHLETKIVKTGRDARVFLEKRLRERQVWASRYNTALEAELIAILEELNSLPIGALPVGELKEWTVADEVTGVTFVYQLVKEKP